VVANCMERSRRTSIGPIMMPPLRGFFLKPQRLIMAPFETCRPVPPMSVLRGRPEVTGARSKRALLTLIGHSAAWTMPQKHLRSG